MTKFTDRNEADASEQDALQSKFTELQEVLARTQSALTLRSQAQAALESVEAAMNRLKAKGPKL